MLKLTDSNLMLAQSTQQHQRTDCDQYERPPAGKQRPQCRQEAEIGKQEDNAQDDEDDGCNGGL
jgi:hypothetical protein